ncbi:scabin-related ADP-ribosyltransferase [Actinokineospora sp.]|uniref:scabin-related ADP-ribosyltransferase n=1 Tax=Actinokineospora sp. TaxID=1872133 RepID=UPI003D6B5EC3
MPQRPGPGHPPNGLGAPQHHDPNRTGAPQRPASTTPTGGDAPRPDQNQPRSPAPPAPGLPPVALTRNDPSTFGVPKLFMRDVDGWMKDENVLYRGDTRSPEEIKADGGFRPLKPDSPDLKQHVHGDTNAFVSTSTDQKVGVERAGTGEGRLYVINAPGGILTDPTMKAAGETQEYSESEVLFPGGIDWRYVAGWHTVRHEPGVGLVPGPFEPNPDYIGNKQADGPPPATTAAADDRPASAATSSEAARPADGPPASHQRPDPAASQTDQRAGHPGQPTPQAHQQGSASQNRPAQPAPAGPNREPGNRQPAPSPQPAGQNPARDLPNAGRQHAGGVAPANQNPAASGYPAPNQQAGGGLGQSRSPAHGGPPYANPNQPSPYGQAPPTRPGWANTPAQPASAPSDDGYSFGPRGYEPLDSQQAPHAPTPPVDTPARTPVPRAETPRPAEPKPERQPRPLRLKDLDDERLAAAVDGRAHATKAGMSIFDPGERNESYTANQVKPISGQFVIDLHGGENHAKAGRSNLSADDLAAVLMANPDWDRKTPITLLGCGTGKLPDGFAAQLAAKTGVKVTAPNTDAWVDYDGNVFASESRGRYDRDGSKPGWPPNGEWRSFDPDGTQQVHGSPYPPGHTPTWGDDTPDNAPTDASRRGETDRAVDSALNTAATGRTDSGGVPPDTVEALINSLPAIHTAGNDLHARLTDFVTSSLDQGRIDLQALGGGGAKGVSGAPVFLVRDESGAVTAVTKVFPDTTDFARDLSSLELLRSLDLSFEVARPLAIGMIHSPDGHAGTVVYSVAAGKPIDDLVRDAANAVGDERAHGLRDLSTAVRQTAKALAELHTRPEGSGGPVGENYIESHRRAMLARADQLLENRDLLRNAGLDVDELRVRVEQIVEATRREPGMAAYAHGDAHPGNFFWDQERNVTFIDTTTVHYSIDADGRPVGSPERDLGNFEQWLATWGRQFGLTAPEIAELRDDFAASYIAAGGDQPSRSTLALFAARSALTPTLYAMNALRADLAEPGRVSAARRRDLMAELNASIMEVKRALGWKK